MKLKDVDRILFRDREKTFDVPIGTTRLLTTVCNLGPFLLKSSLPLGVSFSARTCARIVTPIALGHQNVNETPNSFGRHNTQRYF